jgi:2-polyprenyl-3-methyl-5-hydroxy-6-metoxy-1,4-benzoquinol methylase
MNYMKKTRVLELVRILDVGCGSGLHVAYLRNQGYDVVGLDRSKDAIDYCKTTHFEHADAFRHGDAQLPTQFRDGAFSHIVCLNSTIYYMDDPRTFFRNCAKWLKDGGRMFVHMVDDIEQRYYDTNGWVRMKSGIRYKSTYDVIDGKTMFDEKVKDVHGNVMRNQHVLHNVGQTERLLEMAERSDLRVTKKYSLKRAGFEHHYMYVLQKGNDKGSK